MVKKLYIKPYNGGSASAKKLAEALECKRIKQEGSAYVGKASHVLINWGNSQLDERQNGAAQILNKASAVKDATNKLVAFRLMHEAGVKCPNYWTSADDLEIDPEDALICVRQKLNGHSGEGLSVKPFNQLTAEDKRAPLFVEYVKKATEWRVHIGVGGDDRKCFIQKKARRRDVPDEQVDWQIRNHVNGFIYQHNDLNINEAFELELEDLAADALQALDLDFGAVDIIQNGKKGLFVLEVNTAPGLEGKTLEHYTEYFKEFI